MPPSRRFTSKFGMVWCSSNETRTPNKRFYLCKQQVKLDRSISTSQLNLFLTKLTPNAYITAVLAMTYMRALISRWASYLYAFSSYPSAHSYPAYPLGRRTGIPAVRPSESSRTTESSSQCSNAYTGYGPNCLTHENPNISKRHGLYLHPL